MEIIENENETSVTFNSFDRCDRCGAQALAVARSLFCKSELLFCNHHKNKYADELNKQNFFILEDKPAIERLVKRGYVTV